MPNCSWANPEQLKFLSDYHITFSDAQTGKTLPTFWTDIYREFFILWPDQASEAYTEVDDMPARKKKKKDKTPE